MTTTINIAKDFSRFPAGLTNIDGPNNAWRFRNEILIPALEKGSVIIELDGTLGYASNWLAAVFKNLDKVGFSKTFLFNSIQIKSFDSSLETEIFEYLLNEK